MRINFNYFLVFTLLFVFAFGNAQNNTSKVGQLQTNNQQFVKQQKVLTSFQERSAQTKTIFSEQIINNDSDFSSGKEAEIIWQYTDPAGILSSTKTNGITEKTVGAWELNDERISVFGDNSVPEWEYLVNSEWSFPIDMTSDGQYIVYGADDEIKVFAQDNPTPIWDFSFVGIAEGLCISSDGLKVYVAYEDYDGIPGTKVACYNVGVDIPVWSIDFPGNNEGLVLNEGGTVLMLTQYGGDNSAINIIKAETGDIIMTTPNQNQSLPAISYDGKIIARGDYSGYLYVYEYDEESEIYIEKWNANVNTGTGTWVLGLSVSGDGSTIAAGTLVFTSSGGYDGELFVYNTFSSTHLWKFSGAGDEIASIDLSYDGSIIAAAGYGPIDNSKPDFYLFRKNSNNPYFTKSTSGSMFSTDLSEDGMIGSFGGKLVHARIMGSGGLLYSVNSNPGGGTLSGTVNLLDTDDNSGVKIYIPDLDTYYDFSTYNGDYTVDYIPAGIYTIVASKVGYYPISEDNITITDDEITELNFEMEATGNPPTNLMATKGASLSVELSWDAPEAREYFGFYIYRKNNLEESFPEEPLSEVSADEYTYNDELALPTNTYFYAITAKLGEDVQSPYSNIAEGWVCTGFIANEIDVYEATTIPTIDGVISEGEWDDAFQIDCSDFLGTYDNTLVPVGSVMGYYKMNEEATEMYVAYYDLNDTEIEDHDEVALYIDDNGDGSFPPAGDDSEGNFWVAHYASGDVIKYRPIHAGGTVGDVIYLDNPQIAVSIDAGYMVYEFVIPMGAGEYWELNPGPENKSTLAIFILNDPSDFDGWWPYNNTDLFSPAGFQTMKFNATNEVPPAPESLFIELISESHIMLDWEMAPIDDFDHYNVYSSASKDFEIIGSTIGNQYFYDLPNSGYFQFYITTVDHSGQESDPSQIVFIDFHVGIQSLENVNIVSAVPNPFSNQVTLSFFNPEKAKASMQVYSMNGTNVAILLQDELNIGEHSINWSGCDDSGARLPTGIYFYRLMLNNNIYLGKIVLK